MSAVDPPENLSRIKTGSSQLDSILHGGFPNQSINILMGEPGSGKTILVERLIFANAEDANRPILYFTTLSEPLEKVVRYLQQFEFYDEDKITSGAIVYESIAPELSGEGPSALVKRIREAILTRSPKMIIVDSFKAIHDLSTSLPEMRRMLYEISSLLSAYDTTAFLVGEYSEDQLAQFPEFAIADGVVELARRKHGTRDERYLRVLKLRGSKYSEGLHAFRITSKGLDVFPRLTTPNVPLSYLDKGVRIPTGVASLDRMMQGGLLAGSSTLVEGATGSGKTTFALQFLLEGLRRGEPGLYVSFQENPTQLARNIERLGWNVQEAISKGLRFSYTSPVELQIDSIVVSVFHSIKEDGVKRIVVDSAGDLISAASDIPRLYGYLYSLVQHFVVQRVASMMTLETSSSGAHIDSKSGMISAMADSVINLRSERRGDQMRRTLQVVKSRATDHDLRVHEYNVSLQGIEIL
jgi:circadian clock protein KaiC